MTEAPGTCIGPYQLLAKIGQGGMGTVHLAKWAGAAGVSKLAVVKVLHPHLLDSALVVEMFLNEARLAARLTHPNVVHTYGADEDRGRLYIAMEHLDGQPWSRVRRRLWTSRSLPLATHLKVLVDTLAGLHYAHELCDYDGNSLSVVHCDISPHNVFVTYEGQAKIVDFGVARAVTGTESPHADQFAGKLAYAAPEQLTSEGIDRRADIFAVGVMLWEALAGRSYVTVDDHAQVVRNRVQGNEPRVRDVVPSVPRPLADICDRATARVRDERFSTALEMRHALMGYLTELSPEADDAQLGRLIANAFREERRHLHALIKHHLPSPGTQPSRPVPSSTQPGRPVPSSTQPGRPVPSSTQPGHSVPPSTPRSRSVPPNTQPPMPSAQADVLSQRVERELVGQVEEAENTMRADLSEFASVSKIEDDRALAHASVVASVRAARRGWNRRAAIATAAAIGTLLGVLGIVVWGGPSPSAKPLAAAASSKETPASADEGAHDRADPRANEDRKPVRGGSKSDGDSVSGEREPAPEKTAPTRAARRGARNNKRSRPTRRGRALQADLAVSPKEATLYLDGEPLPSNPFQGRLPKDGAKHSIRAEADGYASARWEVKLDHNLRLRESLVPIEETSRSATSSSDQAPASSQALASSSGASASAEPTSNAPTKQKSKSEAEATPDAPTADEEDPSYGLRVEPERAPRKIFEEDPYQ